MPQLRQDLVTGRWVAIATERARRPNSFTRGAAEAVNAGAECPFCPGRESLTPPEVLAYRADSNQPDSPGWEVRVVPNLFPAFGPANGMRERAAVGPYQTMNGVGVHEVIISGPSHYVDLADLPLEHVERVVDAYVDRIRARTADDSAQYLMIINNHGREAGASLAHPHSQLFGIPLIPPQAEEEFRGIARYRGEHASCVYCDIIAFEQTARERIIFENEHFLVYAPFASRVPFEAAIVPLRHSERFEELAPLERTSFAEALKVLTGRLTHGLNDPPYNFYIHSAPAQGAADLDYHWHVELLPKLTIAAGFELGSGMMINVATPESAAEFLRQVDLRQQTQSPALELH